MALFFSFAFKKLKRWKRTQGHKSKHATFAEQCGGVQTKNKHFKIFTVVSICVNYFQLRIKKIGF